MSALERLADGIDAFIDWVGRTTSWLTLILVLLIATEVLLRYAFSLGAVWAQELEWHLLAVIALWGIAYTQKEDAHVRVDIFYQGYRQRTRDWVEFLSAVFIMAPISFYVAYLSIPFVEHSHAIGEISPDPGGLTHRWILKSFVTSGFLLLGLQSLAIALKQAAILLRGRREG
ncbi:TRAP transporter small permease subunit [Pelomicrobium methylotrophicum]|uniref:TRAP transporter small permease subunit n=1 Tax=Pelomicrobium methylotrophicum TaxID=2602750 RepID=UPI001969BC23|nr:TRAP transporter small permease subunit [Pelomicrobium methylotrophicum]